MGAEADLGAPYMSSSGEMNISLRLMTFACSAVSQHPLHQTYVLMTKMLQQLQFSVGSL